ncbi:MAG: hypothetical protein NVS4B8_30070 [Herpetosiphon sp.]
MRLPLLWRAIGMILGLTGSVLQVQAQEFPTRLVTLGSDLTPQQRAAALQRFGAPDGANIIPITADDVRAALNGAIPLAPSFTSTISTAVTCTAPGTGVHVISEQIAGVAAGMYAAAFLAAGIFDADVLLLAPKDGGADGKIALVGPLKALTQAGCGSGVADQKRRELAVQTLALNDELVAAGGKDTVKAANFVLRCLQVLIREKNNPDAAYPIVDGVQRDIGVTLSPDLRKRVAEHVAAVAQGQKSWGPYAQGLRIELQGIGEGRTMPGATGASGAVAGGSTYSGSVAGTSPLRILVPGEMTQLQLNGNHVTVQRDTMAASLKDLRVGDSVTVTVDGSGSVGQITAQSPTRTYQGTAGAILGDQLPVTGSAGRQTFGVGGAAVLRNGKRSSLNALQPGDEVTVALDQSDKATLVTATSKQSGITGIGARLRRFWWLLALLLGLVVLILLVRRRQQAGAALVVVPQRGRGGPFGGTDPAGDEDDLG